MKSKKVKDTKKSRTSTNIMTEKEHEQDIHITMDEISAEIKEKENPNLSEEGLRASIDTINPDEGSMESRG